MPRLVQPSLEEDEIGRLPRHVDRLFDRQTGVGGVHGRRVVDAVSEKSDDVPHLLQRENDAFFLIRIDFDEEICLLRDRPEGLVVKRREIPSGDHAFGAHADE